MDKNSTVTLRTGNKMPVMGLGTWQLTHNTAETVAYALEIGYRLIDTSGNYGTQPGVGAGIKQSQVDRNMIYLTTKVEATDDAYERTLSNLEELNLDYADLMLIHWPPLQGAGEALWEGLRKAQREELVRDIGVSNYSIELIETLIKASGVTPAVNQIEWSPFDHSHEMLAYCQENNIIIQTYSPLTRKERLSDARLTKIAAHYSKSPAQILIRWNIQQGHVPLPKASQRDHIAENIDVFDFEISDEDMNRLNSFNEAYSSTA